MKGGLIQTNTLSGDGRNPARCQQQPTIPDTDRREPKTPLTKADLIAADFKGSWPMFGTNLRMKVGGYLKADLLHFFSMWGIVTCDGAGRIAFEVIHFRPKILPAPGGRSSVLSGPSASIK